MNYKFVIIGDCPIGSLKEYYNYAFNEVKELDYAFFDNCFSPNNSILKLFYKIHISQRINNIINLPFKELWYKKRINRLLKIFKSEDKICFILFSSCLEYENAGFSKIIREKFPNSKIVYFFHDLVRKNILRKELAENNHGIADLIYTYDFGDSQKYNLKFHNVPYSEISFFSNNIQPKYDVSFVGRVKDRLDVIISAYNELKNQGLSCGFFITGVPKEKQILKDEIHYCNLMKYEEYLKIAAKSKCLLEIIQNSGTGNTLRVNEAIILNKLLITNNKWLKNNPIYDSENMKITDNFKDINVKAFIDSHKIVCYKNKKELLPSAFFKQIEKDLNELEEKDLFLK